MKMFSLCVEAKLVAGIRKTAESSHTLIRRTHKRALHRSLAGLLGGALLLASTGCAADSGSVRIGPSSAGAGAPGASAPSSIAASASTRSSSSSSNPVSEATSVVITHHGKVLSTVQLKMLDTKPGEKVEVPEGAAGLIDVSKKQNPLVVFAHATKSNQLGEFSKQDFSEIYKLVPGDKITYFEGAKQREFTVATSEAVKSSNALTVPQNTENLNGVWAQVGGAAPYLRLVTVEDKAMTAAADYQGHWVVTAESSGSLQGN